MINIHDGTATLEELLEKGWHDAENDPPEKGNEVLVAFEDGSTGPSNIGFYDTVLGEEKGECFWWMVGQGLHKVPNNSILAWRPLN